LRKIQVGIQEGGKKSENGISKNERGVGGLVPLLNWNRIPGGGKIKNTSRRLFKGTKRGSENSKNK